MPYMIPESEHLTLTGLIGKMIKGGLEMWIRNRSGVNQMKDGSPTRGSVCDILLVCVISSHQGFFRCLSSLC